MSMGSDIVEEVLADRAPLQPLEIAARSPFELFWRRLKHDKFALGALVFIGLLILVAVFAGLLVNLFGAHPPNQQNSKVLVLPFGDAAPPSGSYWFGTDGLGRDVLSRTLYGARVSLMVAFIATTLTVFIGVSLGMIAGYYRGWVDSALSRTMDVMLAFPVLLLALGLGAACALKGCLATDSVGRTFAIIGVLILLLPVGLAALSQLRGRAGFKAVTREDWMLRLAPGAVILIGGLILTLISGSKKTLIEPGLPVVIFVIVVASWPYIARLIRGQVLSLREKEFVEAARSLGASDSRIIFRHILPNLVAPIIVYTTLLIPTNILFEAALSFLGVGVQPPTSSWGAMIADAVATFSSAWWYMLFPGIALVLTVLAFNLVGDGLQDALNPKTGR
jgi:ABC-type dipeptide/oligopeptide/nickel transport system permease subunit